MKAKNTCEDTRVDETVMRQLAHFFFRNGYVRRQNEERKTKEGSNRYKKGCEIRLTARDFDELQVMRFCLKAAKFKAGRPFRKKRLYCLPIYGKQAVERFLQMVNSVSND